MTANAAYHVKADGKDLDKSDTPSTFLYRGIRYHIVPKRWGMLLIVCWILLLDIITLAFFAFINDVTSAYFRTLPAVTDLLSTINLVARAFFGVVICFFSEKLTFRRIAMIASGLMTAANILILCGVSSRDNFLFVIAGQILSGSASALVLSVVQLVAFNWFPLWERGKAVSFPWVTRRLSTVFSNLIATRSLGEFTFKTESERDVLDPDEDARLTFKFKLVFSIVYGVLAFGALLCCIMSRIYVTERPPVCENTDTTNKIKDETDESTSLLAKEPFSLKKELQGLKYLFTDKSFLLIFAIYCFILTVRPLADILISSLIIGSFPQINDQFVGIMYCAGITVGSLGSPTAGQILDKLARPRLTFLVFNGVVIIALSVFSVSLRFQYIVPTCIAYVVILFTRDATMVCMSHRITGTMSKETNATRVKAFSLSGSVTYLNVAISTVIIRIIMINSNAAIAVTYPIPFLAISSLWFVFLWEYLRDT